MKIIVEVKRGMVQGVFVDYVQSNPPLAVYVVDRDGEQNGDDSVAELQEVQVLKKADKSLQQLIP